MLNSTHQNDEASSDVNKAKLLSSVGRTSKIKELESNIFHEHQVIDQRPSEYGKQYNGVSGKD